MTQDKITPEKVRELLNNATPGEWTYIRFPMKDGGINLPRVSVGRYTVAYTSSDIGCEGNGELISAAPAIARAYLDKCKELMTRDIELGNAYTEMSLLEKQVKGPIWGIEEINRLQTIIDRQQEVLEKMSMEAFKLRDSRSDHQDWEDHQEYARGFEEACEDIHERLVGIYNDLFYSGEVTALTRADKKKSFPIHKGAWQAPNKNWMKP